MRVKLGQNVVLMGSNQHTEDSEKIASAGRALEVKIAKEQERAIKEGHPEWYPGKFYFVDSYTKLQKILALALFKVQVQDSKRNEANGSGEENILANCGYNATNNSGIGALSAQGIIVRPVFHEVDGRWQWDYLGKVTKSLFSNQEWEALKASRYIVETDPKTAVIELKFYDILHPSEMVDLSIPQTDKERIFNILHAHGPMKGNILVPNEDNSKSWIDTVDEPLQRLWNSKNKYYFWEGAVLGPALDRAADYLLTSAANLMAYEKVLVRKEKYAQVDQEARAEIVEALDGDQDTIEEILHKGRNQVGPFGFKIGDKVLGNGTGVEGFLKEEEDLESLYGYEAFVHHYIRGDFQNFLVGSENYRGIFYGTPAGPLMNKWINDLAVDTELTIIQKGERMERFLDSLSTDFHNKLKKMAADKALISPGGIKFDHIAVQRQGSLMTGVVSDQALEAMLLKAQGLYGVIVGITPIPNLMDFLQW